jgi:hypothetical protein
LALQPLSQVIGSPKRCQSNPHNPTHNKSGTWPFAFRFIALEIFWSSFPFPPQACRSNGYLSASCKLLKQLVVTNHLDRGPGLFGNVSHELLVHWLFYFCFCNTAWFLFTRKIKRYLLPLGLLRLPRFCQGLKLFGSWGVSTFRPPSFGLNRYHLHFLFLGCIMTSARNLGSLVLHPFFSFQGFLIFFYPGKKEKKQRWHTS